MPIDLEDFEKGEVVYADTTTVIREKKWCHGNRHSLRAQVHPLVVDIYAYGPQGGEVCCSSFIPMSLSQVRVCPECGFVFEGTFKIGTVRDGYLRTSKKMWKILDIIGMELERPPTGQ